VVKRSGRKEVAISAGGAGGANPLLLRGARTIRTLSARYIADLQDHWEIHGREALDEYRHKFVDRYVENYALLARIIRVEADVKHSMQKPKTVEEALAELESKVGAKGRRKFEKLLREVAKDSDEDAIDVESK
jgi:hypothetical protein